MEKHIYVLPSADVYYSKYKIPVHPPLPLYFHQLFAWQKYTANDDSSDEEAVEWANYAQHSLTVLYIYWDACMPQNLCRDRWNRDAEARRPSCHSEYLFLVWRLLYWRREVGGVFAVIGQKGQMAISYVKNLLAQ